MLSPILSHFSAKWPALLAVGVLFAACAVETPTNSGNTEKSKPNQNPKVSSVAADPTTVSPSQRSTITVTASDPDNDQLSYSYTTTGGTISGSGKTVTFVAGNTTGSAYVTVTVNDGRGGVIGGYVVITIR